MELSFDLTPDPKVLIALTHTPLQPLDALCELIDNSIDSFQVARLRGQPIEFPLIVVDIPGAAEVDRGEGVLRVRDNGPGLSRTEAEKALRAGYSGNTPFDSLGLFGMGFNISTGKLGRATRILTALTSDPHALEGTVDLVKLQEARSYQVPCQLVDKPDGLKHGTVVEVTGWWREGNPNSGFIKRLAGYQKRAVRSQLGRRYATLLRDEKVRILVNGEPCKPFEHCVWHEARSVERQKHGRIPARYNFNQILSHQTRCSQCGALVAAGTQRCQECGSESVRTLEERVRGWVGIQRFDAPNDFGIDLIRNGRVIRVAEKAAFFEFTDELGRTVTDYPIDSPYGRIVGEVHLNHVPVDFLKQDFQRPSGEWRRAIAFLRGESSLQPEQPGADKNTSPVFKLFQGYRRVRKPGTADMYPGYWDRETDKPKRISRQTESEYFEKFQKKLPGYHDDSEWWKLVEQADQRPAEGLVECTNPECRAQNLETEEVCQICSTVLLGQPCVNGECGAVVARSAASCAQCGTSQVPDVREPWTCAVCTVRNDAGADRCGRCGSALGAEDPYARDFLLANADLDDDLSIPGCSIPLSDGTFSSPIDVEAYTARRAIVMAWQGPQIPIVSFKGEKLQIIVDKGHRLFRTFHVKPEQAVAAEVAQYLYTLHGRLSGHQHQGSHGLGNLMWLVMERRWGDVLEDTPDHVRDDARGLMDTIRGRLPSVMQAFSSDIFDELTEKQKKSVVHRLLGAGRDIALLGAFRTSGEFLEWIDEETVVELAARYPDAMFDGGVWDIQYKAAGDLETAVLAEYQDRIRSTYLNCLADVATYVSHSVAEPVITRRVRSSLDYLGQRLIQ